jgi:hypothetical protein
MIQYTKRNAERAEIGSALKTEQNKFACVSFACTYGEKSGFRN